MRLPGDVKLDPPWWLPPWWLRRAYSLPEFFDDPEDDRLVIDSILSGRVGIEVFGVPVPTEHEHGMHLVTELQALRTTRGGGTKAERSAACLEGRERRRARRETELAQATAERERMAAVFARRDEKRARPVREAEALLETTAREIAATLGITYEQAFWHAGNRNREAYAIVRRGYGPPESLEDDEDDEGDPMASRRLTDEEMLEIILRVVHEEMLKFQGKLLAKLRAEWGDLPLEDEAA